MSNSHKFRFVGAPATSDTWSIEGDELHHMVKVLRVGRGDHVEVTDCAGKWVEGVVRAVDKLSAEILVERAHDDGAVTSPLVLCIGALKGGDVDELVAPLTEMGVDELWIFLQEKDAKKRIEEKTEKRWQRHALAALKQSKRSRIMEIKVFSDLAEALSAAETFGNKLVLHPGAGEHLVDQKLRAQSSTIAVVGSERGLSEKELDRLSGAGFSQVALGPHVLRSLTASLATAAVLRMRHSGSPS